jgi:hypothetical protein
MAARNLSVGDTMKRTALAAMILLAACSSNGTEPDEWRRVVGQIEPSLSSVQAVRVPAAAVVNVPFSITINTVGSSTCTRADGAAAAVAGQLALVTPYDRIAPDGTGCTRDLRAFPRDVSLRFSSPGEARIRVQARGLDHRTLIFEVLIPVRAG